MNKNKQLIKPTDEAIGEAGEQMMDRNDPSFTVSLRALLVEKFGEQMMARNDPSFADWVQSLRGIGSFYKDGVLYFRLTVGQSVDGKRWTVSIRDEQEKEE